MEILELIKSIKLDFTQTVIEWSSGSSVVSSFELNPRDFLRFAKKDFKDKDDRDLINALTNCKRAIDCQIDTAFKVYGIGYDKINKASEIIVNICGESTTKLPFKLKLVEAINLAPAGLISKTRNLRNRLEHYYEKPSVAEVKDAIELSELFILSFESNLKIIEDNFTINSEVNYSTNEEKTEGLSVKYDLTNKRIEITGVHKNQVQGKAVLTADNQEYYAMLKIINSQQDELDCEEALICFLKMIKHPIPEKNVKLKFKSTT